MITNNELDIRVGVDHTHNADWDPNFLRKVNFFAGVLSGAAGVLAGHPLDTVKVRLQTQPQGAQVYRGTWHCFRTIIQKEGFKGLYKGLSSPLISLTAINAIVFGVHGSVSREFADKESLKAHFFAGCAAGAVQSVVAAPSERLKLLIQIQSDDAHTKFRSPIHAARSLVAEKGLFTLSRGFWATLVRDCPALGIYFASYEYMARGMSKDGTMESLTGPQLLLAGGGAGMISWLFNYPTDVIKTRFQADDSYKNYWDCIQKTYAERGYRTFFVGLGPTLIRAFPTNAATFFTVEWTYRILIDLNILNVGRKLNEKPIQVLEFPEIPLLKRHISLSDLWGLNCLFYLPEAGSTSLDPMLHGCRLL